MILIVFCLVVELADLTEQSLDASDSKFEVYLGFGIDAGSLL